MKIKKLAKLSVLILIPLLSGFISNAFIGDVPMNYQQIIRPSISPPPYVFPIVWTILYILMGISSYFIFESDSELKGKALKVYALQLVLNFFWSIIFFGFNTYALAFVWLIALIIVIIYMIYLFFKIDKKAAYLNIPYLLWCIFAAYLNFMIVILN